LGVLLVVMLSATCTGADSPAPPHRMMAVRMVPQSGIGPGNDSAGRTGLPPVTVVSTDGGSGSSNHTGDDESDEGSNRLTKPQKPHHGRN
jgi:hypothetical protein